MSPETKRLKRYWRRGLSQPQPVKQAIRDCAEGRHGYSAYEGEVKAAQAWCHRKSLL